MHDDKILRQIVRQLRWINIILTTFGLLMLGALIALALLLFQVITFVRDAGDRLQGIQQQTSQTLDLRAQACNGDDSFSRFLREQTSACREE